MQRFIQKSNRKWLLLSLLANAVLGFVCLYLFVEVRETYRDYRYFRALPVGTSEASTAKAADNTIVLYGDSRIETWYPLLENEKYRIVNAGISGETTTEMKRRFEQDVLRLKPDYVLIQAGMNDLTTAVTKGIGDPNLPLSAMHENFRYLIKTLEDQGTNVIVTSIIPAKPLNLKRKLLWHNKLTEYVTDTNKVLEQTSMDLGADWIDLDPLYLDSSGKIVPDLYYDTLHINWDGYKVLNQQIGQFLKNL